MFDNIGKKLKKWSGIIFVVEIILLVLLGVPSVISALHYGGVSFVVYISILIIVGGGLFAWISSALIYAFGELIEKTDEISKNTLPSGRKVELYKAADLIRVEELKKMLSEDLITEDEYNASIAKTDFCIKNEIMEYSKHEKLRDLVEMADMGYIGKEKYLIKRAEVLKEL